MNEETREVLNVVKDMFEILTDQIKEIKSDVTELKSDVTELKQRVIKVETSLENETNRNIKILVDGHIQNADKLEKLDKIENDVEHIKLKTDVLESVTKLHSFDINRLKKAK